MEIDLRKLRIWTGASEKSRESLESWELATCGYAEGQGLYPLLHPTYTRSSIRVDTSTDDVRRVCQGRPHHEDRITVVPACASHKGITSTGGEQVRAQLTS